ncbi:hypothetical protein [Amycolatopsis sp. NBC_01286]|uniref:hypothetical protein n=1 Tax=Amycolatopsis sp. NBC_01286 TaxID=2903560 RepID=UPI002E1316A4|nr:hypothetical protein OG570_28625 [Amycolatopsis sp. NBC_01286]
MSEQNPLGRIVLHGQERLTVLSYDASADTYLCRDEATGEEKPVHEEDIDDFGEWTERV